MNKQQQERWKSQKLELILKAFAAHAKLKDALVFKGARILSRRLGEDSRQSLDIDSNLDLSFVNNKPSNEERRVFLEEQSKLALKRFFTKQDPVVHEVESVTVEMNPPDGIHPYDWTGYKICIRIRDNERPGVKGLPTIKVDVASYEMLGDDAVSDLTLGDGLDVKAYTVERIAGEKMRAFLSSLPSYIRKIHRRPDAVRVKDLYDLARIQRIYPIRQHTFWEKAAREFKMACESRFIDCAGISTFSENLETTRQSYEADSTIPSDIVFDEAWAAVQKAVEAFELDEIIPFTFPLPGQDLQKNEILSRPGSF